MTLQYNLMDEIGWTTTRWVPLCQPAVDSLLVIVGSLLQSENDKNLLLKEEKKKNINSIIDKEDKEIKNIGHVKTFLDANYSKDFLSFSTQLAGINKESSIAYRDTLSLLSNNPNFISQAEQIIVPLNLFNVLEYMTYTPSYSLSSDEITLLFNTLELTPEFSVFIESLSGITPENSRDYLLIIQQMLTCPKFVMDAMSGEINL